MIASRGSDGRDDILLDVRNLSTYLYTGSGVVRAVNDVSFAVRRGETLALVGESGCGKSMTALSLMRLVPSPPARIVAGEVLFEGNDLLRMTEAEMRGVRGAKISMIFQEPMTSLNPVLTVGSQLTEGIRLHLGLGDRQANERARDLLAQVGIPDPAASLKKYPHQMSGGQRQRVMIAIALSCNPQLVIADEATTALDVTIQAQILELLIRLSEEFSTATMIITHNLGIVARYAHHVNVMYAGRIRESGTATDIYESPSHPYTIGLLNAVPRLDQDELDRLPVIPGEIPDPLDLPSGCPFRPRCRWAKDRCAESDPQLATVASGHQAACWESAVVASETA